MDTALYFPYIQVPQTPWFTQILLYWDRAATIVPDREKDRQALIHPYMAELANSHLLDYIVPGVELWTNDQAQQFYRGFLDVLGDTRGPIPGSGFSRIHVDKLPHELFKELQRRELATEEPGPPEPESWWQVERTTAGKYMAYLASAISGARENTFPVTDTKAHLATLDGDLTDDVDLKLARLRYSLITKALPAPHGPVAARDLCNFKEKYGAELQRCRTYIDGKLADVAAHNDEHLRQIKQDAVTDEFQRDVAVLMEQMGRRKWPKVALVGVAGVAGVGLGVAGTVITGGAALGIGLLVGSAALSTGPAGYQLAKLLKAPRYNRHAPLAYAALAARL